MQIIGQNLVEQANSKNGMLSSPGAKKLFNVLIKDIEARSVPDLEV